LAGVPPDLELEVVAAKLCEVSLTVEPDALLFIISTVIILEEKIVHT
jgi:hypothetical protein